MLFRSLQDGLVVDEKCYRVCNYIVSLREGLYNLAAAAGIENPTQFERKHIVHKDELGIVSPVEDLIIAAKETQLRKEG